MVNDSLSRISSRHGSDKHPYRDDKPSVHQAADNLLTLIAFNRKHLSYRLSDIFHLLSGYSVRHAVLTQPGYAFDKDHKPIARK